MNYRALEDLIGILVKKSGYKLSDLKVLEDKDYLLERKEYLTNECDKLRSKIEEDKYVDKDKKTKLEEEKKYLEDTLSSLQNDSANLSSKLEDNNLDDDSEIRTKAKLDVVSAEIARVKDSVKLIDFKLDKKCYTDSYSKCKDKVLLESLESEIKRIDKSLDIKENNPVLIGNTLLDKFKSGEKLESVREELDCLIKTARNNYEHTLEEVKGSNIFELIDKYTNKKRNLKDRLDDNDYNDEKEKENIFEKSKYHNKRIETFRSTIDGIDKRKKELEILIEESDNLYLNTRSERISKEQFLDELLLRLYHESNLSLIDQYSESINVLRQDIINDKALENKYNQDIQVYMDEIRNLDINTSSLHNEIITEEKCLDILNSKVQNDVTLSSRFEDEIDLLHDSNRITSLENEQQYLYVNVDVIKNEIEELWNRGNSGSITETSSMYDEEKIKEDNIENCEEETLDNESIDEKTNEEIKEPEDRTEKEEDVIIDDPFLIEEESVGKEEDSLDEEIPEDDDLDYLD